jgi:hypothetical protein
MCESPRKRSWNTSTQFLGIPRYVLQLKSKISYTSNAVFVSLWLTNVIRPVLKHASNAVRLGNINKKQAQLEAYLVLCSSILPRSVPSVHTTAQLQQAAGHSRNNGLQLEKDTNTELTWIWNLFSTNISRAGPWQQCLTLVHGQYSLQCALKI